MRYAKFADVSQGTAPAGVKRRPANKIAVPRNMARKEVPHPKDTASAAAAAAAAAEAAATSMGDDLRPWLEKIPPRLSDLACAGKDGQWLSRLYLGNVLRHDVDVCRSFPCHDPTDDGGRYRTVGRSGDWWARV